MSMRIRPLGSANAYLSTEAPDTGAGAKPTSMYGCSNPVHCTSFSKRGPFLISVVTDVWRRPTGLSDDDSHARAMIRLEPPEACLGSWTCHELSAMLWRTSLPSGV